MSRKIWRYTLNTKEQKLWDLPEMQGWRDSMVACVEDDAREAGCTRFFLHDMAENVIAKGEVAPLPTPEPIET